MIQLNPQFGDISMIVNTRRPRLMHTCLGLAVLLFVSAACSAPMSSPSSQQADSSAAASPDDVLAAMDECMERAGRDIVSVDADGRTSVDFGAGDPQFQIDFERCQNETGFDGFGPPELTPEDRQRANEELAETVSCMRERGWDLEIVTGQAGGVVLPDVPPAQQDVFDQDLADCSDGDMVQAEPVQP